MYGPLENYHNLLRMTRPAGWPNAQMYAPSSVNLGGMGGAPGTPWHGQTGPQPMISRISTGSGRGMRRRYAKPRPRPWPQPGPTQPPMYTQPPTWQNTRPNIAPGPFGFMLRPAPGMLGTSTIGGMTPSLNNPTLRRY